MWVFYFYYFREGKKKFREFVTFFPEKVLQASQKLRNIYVKLGMSYSLGFLVEIGTYALADV